MGRISGGLIVLSAALALASQSPPAHACCGLDAEAEACREAAIRAELAQLAPPLRFAFTFSSAACEAAINGAECLCDGRCHCRSTTHYLHDDIVLAELEESRLDQSTAFNDQHAEAPRPLVALAFAFSRGEAARMQAEQMDRELADCEATIGSIFAANPKPYPGMTVAFRFAECPHIARTRPYLDRMHISADWSKFQRTWVLSLGGAYPSEAFEQFLTDLKDRENEIAADFAVAAYAMESDGDAQPAAIAATERGVSTLCAARPQFPLNETQTFDDARMIEEQLVHPQASKECLLCEWSIDAPSPEAQPMKQYYEVEWETSPNMPIYPAPPHVPNLIPSNHLVARRPARIHVSIEGAAMRFRDEGGALPVYR
jgi:hypothetical protein